MNRETWKHFRSHARKHRIPNDQHEDPLARRQREANLIKVMEEDGNIAVFSTATDCDHVTVSRVTMIPATLTHYRAWEEAFWDGAEGRQHAGIGRPSDAIDFKPSWRDGIAEAHEDGHAHCVFA